MRAKEDINECIVARLTTALNVGTTGATQTIIILWLDVLHLLEDTALQPPPQIVPRAVEGTDVDMAVMDTLARLLHVHHMA